MSADFLDYLLNPIEQCRIIQRATVNPDAVFAQPARFAHQARNVCKGAHWNWAVVGGHAAELISGDEGRPGAEISWGPVETISVSEAGFERIYQGTAFLLVWQLDDVSSEGWEFTTRLTTRAR